jgi:hypothetical protein
VNDAATKQALCAALDIHAAAIADEGFVIHSPGPAELLCALGRCVSGGEPFEGSASWRLVSNQRATLAELARNGAVGALAGDAGGRGFDYLGFRSAA